MKRVFVSLPDGIWNIIKKDFEKMGDSESEILRNMIIAYLSDRGYFVNPKGQIDTKQIRDRLTITEELLDALIEAVGEKTEISYADIDRIMKKRIHEMSGT